MMLQGHSRRTVFLAVAVVLLAAANFWWFVLRTPQSREPDFELGQTAGLAMRIDAGEAAAAPLFDPIADRWTVRGRPVTDLRPLVRNSGKITDTAPPVDFLSVRLADDAGSDQVRRALLSLVGQGICFVGFIDPGEVSTPDRLGRMPVHRIVSARDAQGGRHTCTPARH